jgi:hypothetical protein
VCSGNFKRGEKEGRRKGQDLVSEIIIRQNNHKNVKMNDNEGSTKYKIHPFASSYRIKASKTSAKLTDYATAQQISEHHRRY